MKAHFRLFGVPVRIDPSFGFLALIIGYFWFLSSGAPNAVASFIAWIPIVTGAILVHELGHALTGRLFGLSPFVMLHGMGGVTQFDGRAHRALSHGRRVLITLAGPLAGIAAGGIVLAAWLVVRPLPDSLADTAFRAAFVVTLGWGVLNLIPMLPLDGGHIVATVLDKVFGIRGVLFARIASIALAVALAALALYAQRWFTLFILGWLAYNNWRSYQLERAWQTEAPLEPLLKRALAALEAGQTAEVRRLGEAIRDAASRPATKAHAAHLLAWAHLLDGDAEAAGRALDTAPRGHRPDALLEGRVRLGCGKPSEAIGPLIEALIDRGDDPSADALASALAGAGRADELIALLESKERSERAGRGALQRVAHQLFTRGAMELAGVAYERTFARFGDADDAFNAACARARLGERAAALRLLGRAIDAGLDDPGVLDDEDLEPVRGPELDALRARLDGRG